MSGGSRARAWIRADAQGWVLASGGDLEGFGILAPPAPGTPLTRVADFLFGLADAGPEGADLPRVQVGERYADVHTVRDEGSVLILLVDVTEEVDLWRRVQQGHNAAVLAAERGEGLAPASEVIADLITAMDAAVFEAGDDGRLRFLAGAPEWLTPLFGEEAGSRQPFDPRDSVPFLETFLENSRRLWESGIPARESSGIWMESFGSEELTLEATAVLLSGGERLLVIASQAEAVQETRRMLQTAREAALDHRSLQREIEKKDLLLECIVHDLKGPLAGMTGSFSMLSRDLAPERMKRMVDMGLRQARLQNEMIQDVLHIFSADLGHIDPTGRNVGSCDVAASAGEALGMMGGELEERGLSSTLDLEESERGSLVVGSSDRLRRVFANLLENAARHTPRGSQIEIGVAGLPDRVRVEVRDRGPGIEAKLAGSVFQHRTGGAIISGSAGLGLFYCASTIERWGGSIGYRARSGGGAVFWFELPRAGDDSP